MPAALLPKPIVYNPESGLWDESDPEWEMLYWPRTLWVDAGTVSGVTVIWFNPVTLLDLKQPTMRSVLAWWTSFVSGPENDQAREIVRLVRGLGTEHGLGIGCEKFVVQEVKKQEEFLSSPRITSKIDYALWSGVWERGKAGDPSGEEVLRRRAVLWQMPGDIDGGPKGDARLQGLGMYRPGADHRNDATKHALLHLARLRNSGMGTFERIYGWNPDWQ